MEFFQSLINWVSSKENITFLIAVIGFLFSLFNFIETRISSHRRLDVSVRYSFCDFDGKELYLVLSLSNKSKLPISVAGGVALLPNRKQCSFGTVSNAVFAYQNPVVSGKAQERTQRFPVLLGPFEATSLFVQVDNWDIEWNRFIPGLRKIVLSTSRGKVKKTVSIPFFTATWRELLPHLR